MMKKKNRLDKILTSCADRIGEDVSSLLGIEVRVGTPKTKVVSKEAFFSDPAGKSVFSFLRLDGEMGGQGGIMVAIRDAIRIGGTLIMLPDSELQEVISQESYTEEIDDSYGEIANIIAGSITAVFEEQYPKPFRVVREDQQVILPVKIDGTSDELIPADLYYVVIYPLSIDNEDYEPLRILLPAEPLEVADVPPPDEDDEQVTQQTAESEEEAAEGDEEKEAVLDQENPEVKEKEAAQAQTEESTTQQKDGTAQAQTQEGTAQEKDGAAQAEAQEGAAQQKTTAAQVADPQAQTTDILIFSDEEEYSAEIMRMAQESGMSPRKLHFKNSVQGNITDNIKLVFVVMQQVSEQGFAVAIKINAGGRNIPLVAAGPEWTKTLVLKAVKYGASDILMTPASDQEILRKIEANIR